MRTSTQNREVSDTQKGISSTSEFLLVMGVMAVAVMFGLVAANVIEFQLSEVSRGAQENLAENLKSNIESMEAFQGVSRTSYTPSPPQHNISLLGNQIKVRIPGRDVSTTRISNLEIEKSCIMNADILRIVKKSGKVSIKAEGSRARQWEPDPVEGCQTEPPLPEPDNATDVPPEEGEQNETDRDLPVYKVAFVPAKYDSGDFQTFKARAQSLLAGFKANSPFRACSESNMPVNATYIHPNRTSSCDIDTCSARKDPKTQDCFDKVKSCAGSTLGEYQLAIGICNNQDKDGDGLGDCIQDTVSAPDLCGTSNAEEDCTLCGRGAGIGDRTSLIFSPHGCSSTGLHMIGHSMGLHGLDPGNPDSSEDLPQQCYLHGDSCKGVNSEDCYPRRQATQYIMSFCDLDRKYGPSAMDYMRRKLKLQGYLKRCEG